MYNYLEYFLAALLTVLVVLLIWFLININKIKKL